MSQPIKPPVFIAIVVAAVLLVGVIGYKLIASNTSAPRTDAAAQELYASMAKARAQKQAGSNGVPPAPTHP